MHPFQSLEVPPGKAGIHWFYQNCYALKDPAGTIVQIDPYFLRERPPEVFIHAVPPLDEATLKTDFVLLTHDHSDHTCIESILRIHGAFPACRFIGPPESIARIRGAGVPDALLTAVKPGDAVELGTMAADVTCSKPPHGAPGDGIGPPDVMHVGYVIQAGGVRIYNSGDLINTFGDHDELLAPIRALKPDIGLLTTHPAEGEFPYFEGSVKMAVNLGLKAAVPAHYNCFAKRTFDPNEWAAMLPKDGPAPVIIPPDSTILWPQG